MMKDLLNEFILMGSFLDMPFLGTTTRMTLVRKFGEINKNGPIFGFNKKNGVHEILKESNVFYYFGYGGRGNLSGIRIFDLLPLKIDSISIEEILKKNYIEYTYDKNEMIYYVQNKVKIYFDKNEKFVSEILKANNKIIEEKLLNLEPKLHQV